MRERDPRFFAQAPVAHDGQWQTPMLFVEEFEEAAEIGRAVCASDDFEEMG